jgi:hypothetical protein
MLFFHLFQQTIRVALGSTVLTTTVAPVVNSEDFVEREPTMQSFLPEPEPLVLEGPVPEFPQLEKGNSILMLVSL